MIFGRSLSCSCVLFLLTLSGFARDQPNIIFLIADDLGYGELGCQGNPQIPTPHIDSIAENGVRFTQAYVTAPNCSPSRAGLMTGRYPTRFGYEFNPTGARNELPQNGLPPSETTMAEALHNLGYTTGLVGKWHLGGTAAYHPHRHGFDEFFGFTHEGHYFVPPPYDGVTTMLRRRTLPGNRQEGRWGEGGKLIYTAHMGHDEPDYDANNPILRSGQPVEEKAHLTDAFTREAVDFIRRHADKPFFLTVAYNAVHSPLQGADTYMAKFPGISDVHRRIFAAMLAHLDDSVGAILTELDATALVEDTVVVFLSDNGGPTRELTSSNLPLRGGKGQMYEGGLRVPFLLQWPGSVEGGRTVGHVVSSMDLYPMAIKLAGGDVSEKLDGVDLMPLAKGHISQGTQDELYWRQGPRAALRLGDWKIVRGRRSPWELYNIQKDLEEKRNLAAEKPERLKQLLSRWGKLDEQMKPALFGTR